MVKKAGHLYLVVRQGVLGEVYIKTAPWETVEEVESEDPRLLAVVRLAVQEGQLNPGSTVPTATAYFAVAVAVAVELIRQVALTQRLIQMAATAGFLAAVVAVVAPGFHRPQNQEQAETAVTGW